MNKIDISIIIPIYNVEKYLKKCLDTVYSIKNINKEVILVNDSSPDNCELIIEEYRLRFPKETIVINRKNGGLSAARNSGLEIAKGEYISFIDSDDFINPKEYEPFFLEAKEKDLDIIIGGHKKYKDGQKLSTKLRDDYLEAIGITSGKIFFQKSLELKCFKEEVWDDIYRRDFLKKNNLKFKEGLVHEDTLFSIQALNLAQKVQYINRPFYFYRQRDDSIMSSYNYRNDQHRLYIVKEILKLYNQKKVKGLNEYLINILWIIYINSKETNGEVLREILKKEYFYSFKTYIKLLIILCGSLKSKRILPIEL